MLIVSHSYGYLIWDVAYPYSYHCCISNLRRSPFIATTISFELYFIHVRIVCLRAKKLVIHSATSISLDVEHPYLHPKFQNWGYHHSGDHLIHRKFQSWWYHRSNDHLIHLWCAVLLLVYFGSQGALCSFSDYHLIWDEVHQLRTKLLASRLSCNISMCYHCKAHHSFSNDHNFDLCHIHFRIVILRAEKVHSFSNCHFVEI